MLLIRFPTVSSNLPLDSILPIVDSELVPTLILDDPEDESLELLSKLIP